LTLLNPVIATPPFFPSVVKHIVIKVTDLCPLSTTGWCNATTAGPNAYVFGSSNFSLLFTLTAVKSAGASLNFDLAYPSQAIPDDFFPSDEALYGYTVSCNYV
jgi:hypothetical protein